jgi:hypothetical protein
MNRGGGRFRERGEKERAEKDCAEYPYGSDAVLEVHSDERGLKPFLVNQL